MARECPNKKDGDPGDISWKKGNNAAKRFMARERKANMKAKQMKTSPLPSMDDDGRWVRLNNVLEVPYCPDTGADQNIMPNAMVDELQVLQPQLQVVKLAAPFVGTACSQMPFEASSYTTAGPVKEPGKRRYYVVDEGDEFLVSNDTLNTIGIDMARLQVDDDGDDLEVVGGDCVELPQRSAVRAASLKAALPVAKNRGNPEGMIDSASTDKWSEDDVLKYYRLTNDYRVVNSLTEPKAGTMPFQATILQNLRGKKAMGVFDLPKCFWQFSLHPDSKDMCPTNEECYKDLLYKNLLIWIDDIFVYAAAVEEYVVSLEFFFDRVAQYGGVDASSADGVKKYHERIEHLCAIFYPTNAGELQQFVYPVSWQWDSMTECAQTVDPLQQCLTKAFEGKGKKKRIAFGVQLELTDAEKQAFDAVKSKLRSSVELSHPRDDATMCLFTDASDYGWSIVVTQVVGIRRRQPIPKGVVSHREGGLPYCVCVREA
ncbi:hypothetical protein H257_04234 [Aphanomyces astaci]|uniref:Reverse transcriptase/retrotransposon-derived protein RNase H-like domain-containing protein n=1 Tax=Aphanomyces astaci TaxID=112090 RepID=W4GUV5_APHAT|nr:hypothetical protein H257_04234 [Aphanomyces astaci]ETV83520.1 hypothetical protein H257_04234 [Aphanomyces astaci]|eukprot:XP_009826950.1 hypothetical protein H257_04234 [Aphanomyces astaci]